LITKLYEACKKMVVDAVRGEALTCVYRVKTRRSSLLKLI